MASRYLDFHDGHLLGIRLGEKSAIMFLSKLDGSEHELLLSGVELLRMDEFMQSNIILSIEVVTGERPAANVPLGQLLSPPHPSAPAKYHAAHAEYVERWLVDIESGAASLVILLSSYGAELLALCKEVTFQEA